MQADDQQQGVHRDGGGGGSGGARVEAATRTRHVFVIAVCLVAEGKEGPDGEEEDTGYFKCVRRENAWR